MYRVTRAISSLSALALATPFACAPAHAQPSACKLMADAMILLATTPNHKRIVETAAYKQGTSESEAVETGTTRYLKINGKWRAHPYDARAEAAEIGEATSTSNATCTNAGTADIDGQAARLFRVHEQNDAAVIDSRIWIGTNGLPLKQIIDMDVGGNLGKSHREIRYDYADVQPPKM